MVLQEFFVIVLTPSLASAFCPMLCLLVLSLAEVNKLCYLEESEQWLENVDQTHRVLASGKKTSRQPVGVELGPSKHDVLCAITTTRTCGNASRMI